MPAPRTVRLAELAKRSPVIYSVLRRGWTAWGSIVPPQRVPGIPGRIHHNDLMFEGRTNESIQGYASTGRQAVELIARALEAREKTLEDAGRVLDFGCGHGRVLRYLAQRVPPDRITVCDLDHRAARFCVEEFGVKSIPGSTDLDRVPLESYDVIWMGSVLTHLDREDAKALLRALTSVLLPGGAMVFTTLGPSTLAESEDFRRTYGDKGEKILADLKSNEFSYARYEHYRGDEYGLAWYAPAALKSTVDEASGGRLTLLYEQPRGWANFQDAWAFGSPA